ncbi:universal stress protein [Calothrix sp. UHCC 0171]|uniref:universal stress protein n=1 Tax=Calothrix sp. UHCC 0171 TaxID=3110245 RepID=UPI002B1F0D7D|nr:universal stress protein [Calothrix sp. UHCC 0171]MEA5572689.1 universal stress protein [Calothrix sp. UHCC 0171]
MSWLQKQHVLVPTDFSDASFEALFPARAFVNDVSNLHLLHVFTPVYAVEVGMVSEQFDDETRKKKLKEVIFRKLQNTEFENVNVQVIIGDPSSEIIDYAKKINADLIVIPSEGRTGFSRFLIGSVAERVVRFAHCPVLVLKKPI